MGARVFALLAATALFLSPLAAQTTIAIANSSFESPTPSTFPDYTVGATGWTRTNASIDAGTFSPAIAGTTPAPIDGSQVGYANGFGGLQQVLTNTFAAGQVYTFSVYIGYRSDERNSAQGTGAISLGYLDSGVFMPLSTQSATMGLGQFNFVTGSYQTALAAEGRAIVLQLTSTDSYQVIFDQAQLSVSAIPEPSMFAGALGASALGIACLLRRSRHRRSSIVAHPGFLALLLRSMPWCLRSERPRMDVNERELQEEERSRRPHAQVTIR